MKNQQTHKRSNKYKIMPKLIDFIKDNDDRTFLKTYYPDACIIFDIK